MLILRTLSIKRVALASSVVLILSDLGVWGHPQSHRRQLALLGRNHGSGELGKIRGRECRGYRGNRRWAAAVRGEHDFFHPHPADTQCLRIRNIRFTRKRAAGFRRREDIQHWRQDPYDTAARVAKTNLPIIAVKQGTPPVRPRNYSEAYLPVIIDGRPQAIVAAYVDLTDQYDHFHKAFLVAAVALCLLSGAAPASRPSLGIFEPGKSGVPTSAFNSSHGTMR